MIFSCIFGMCNYGKLNISKTLQWYFVLYRIVLIGIKSILIGMRKYSKTEGRHILATTGSGHFTRIIIIEIKIKKK